MQKLTGEQCRRPSSVTAVPKVHKRNVPFIGQNRATEAFEAALSVSDPCYNLYVCGDYGTGRESYVFDALTRYARTQADGKDLLYVNNFDDENRPRSLELPAGKGTVFAEDLQDLCDKLSLALPKAMKLANIEGQRFMKNEELRSLAQTLEAEFQKQAAELSYIVRQEGEMIQFVPAKTESDDEGKEHLVPCRRSDSDQWTDEERGRYDKNGEFLRQLKMKMGDQMAEADASAKAEIEEQVKAVAGGVIKELLKPLRARYARYREVSAWLGELRDELNAGFSDFLMGDTTPPDAFVRYQANVIVAALKGDGCPVIREDNPTYYNLAGKVEYELRQGYYYTDFTQIVAGALHAARDGFLVLEANALLRQWGSYELLKRTLRSGLLTFEPIGEYGSMVMKTPKPEPLPWNGKVILIGDAYTFYLLRTYDEEFLKLFKLSVTFDDEMDRTDETEGQMANLLVQLGSDQGLLPFELDGLQELLVLSSRMADDSGKLTLRMNRMLQVVGECDAWARTHNKKKIDAETVMAVSRARRRREGLDADRALDSFIKGVTFLQTEGEAVGQINGLAVAASYSGSTFGHPSRITATASMGKGGVVHIERETNQAGPIHNKGLLTLTAWFNGRFARHYPLNFTAQLSFEQLYGGVEGDSATLAEVLALLSELSGLPLRQDLAVTGSVDQKGRVQAIGGVNEKVEGFFDYCAGRGLTGTQGVVIPASNVQHLMLDRRVVDAVEAGQFNLYTVETVDQAVELFFGCKAGEMNARGEYAAQTVMGAVQRQLRYWSLEAPKVLAKLLADGGEKKVRKKTVKKAGQSKEKKGQK